MPRLYWDKHVLPYRMLIHIINNSPYTASVIPHPDAPVIPCIYSRCKNSCHTFFNRNFLRILSMCRWQILSLYSALREFYILLYQTLCIYLYLNKSMASSSSSSPLSSSCTSAHLSRNDHRATTPSFRIQLILETVSRFT